MATSASYIDVSDRALLALEGRDGLDLLQRITTNDVAKLRIGEHAETIFTDGKGRIVDVAVVFRTSETSLILAGRSKGSAQLGQCIARYIVMEDITFKPMDNGWVQFLIFDIKKHDLSPLMNESNGLFSKLKYGNEDQMLCVVDNQVKEKFEAGLAEMGCKRAQAVEYEQFRISHRIPSYPNELCDRFNPLEVGLIDLVSFTKGCYVGQEVIARLDTYQKVHRGLRQIELSAEPRSLPVELLREGGERAGTMTSCIRLASPEQKILGLALLDDRSDSFDFVFTVSGDDLNGKAVLLPN